MQAGAVWLGAVRCSAISSVQATNYRALLSRDELARNRRYGRAADQHRDLVARALLRTALGEQLGIEPQALIFSAGEHGKPQVESGQKLSDVPLQFNLSHAGDWVVLAMARCRIGADIEQTARRNDVLAIAKRYFSPAEQRELALFDGDQQQRFFHYWTLKEAYLKARGEGVSLGLANFSFSLADTARIAITVQPCLEEQASQWRFTSVAPESGYRLALAINSPLQPQYYGEEWRPLLSRRALAWDLP